jgi:hypothetical protein
LLEIVLSHCGYHYQRKPAQEEHMPRRKGSRKKEQVKKLGRAVEHIQHVLEYRGAGSHSPKKYSRTEKYKRDWTRDRDPVPFVFSFHASTRCSAAQLEITSTA